MTYIFPGILLAVVSYHLNKNYELDKGDHLKAKVIHAIFLLLFTYNYYGTFRFSIQIIRDVPGFIRSVPTVGMFSGEVYATVLILTAISGLCTLWFLGQMLKREPQGRDNMIKILPWLGILASFPFYKGMILTEEYDTIMDWPIYIFGLVFMLAFFMGCRKIYKTKFMMNFFGLYHDSELKTQNEWDNMIGKLGDDDQSK